MKNYILTAFMAVATASIVLCSCSQKDSDSGSDPEPLTGSTPPPLTVVVMKLTMPEYKNYVLASNFKDDTCFSSARGNRCIEPIGKSGYSPYWELPNYWLLVDWKWEDFPYAIATALTEQTWDKYVWTNYKEPIPTWPYTEPHTGFPIAELYKIKILNLENYSKAQYGDEMIGLIRATHTGYEIHMSDDSNVCLCDWAEKMDSIWTVLQKDLSAAINKGELDLINTTAYGKADPQWDKSLHFIYEE